MNYDIAGIQMQPNSRDRSSRLQDQNQIVGMTCEVSRLPQIQITSRHLPHQSILDMSRTYLYVLLYLHMCNCYRTYVDISHTYSYSDIPRTFASIRFVRISPRCKHQTIGQQIGSIVTVLHPNIFKDGTALPQRQVPKTATTSYNHHGGTSNSQLDHSALEKYIRLCTNQVLFSVFQYQRLSRTLQSCWKPLAEVDANGQLLLLLQQGGQSFWAIDHDLYIT